jgi:hypothetical protein
MQTTSRRLSTYKLLTASLEHKTINVANEWIPEPGRLFKALPKSALYWYLNEIRNWEYCSIMRQGQNINKYQHSTANIAAPPGINRTEYEAALRQRVESCFRKSAIQQVFQVMYASFLCCCIIASIVTITFTSNQPVARSTVITITATLIVFTWIFLLGKVVARYFNFRILILFLTCEISVSVWASNTLLSSAISMDIWPEWKVAIITAAATLGLVAFVNLAYAILTIRHSLNFYAKHLDDLVIMYCLNIYHIVTVHRHQWGTASNQEDLTEPLMNIVSVIRYYLPRRLGVNRASGYGRDDLKKLAFQVSETAREHVKDLLKVEGRKAILTFTNNYVATLSQGAWLDLPRSNEPLPQRRRIGDFARPLVASLLPILIMAYLSTYNAINSQFKVYGWLFVALWFTASIAAWIDPGLGERLRVLNVFSSFFGSKYSSERKD